MEAPKAVAPPAPMTPEQAVADYLVSKYGFDSHRFVVVGNGPRKPVASNDTESGRARNRRTDFELLNN